MKNISLQLTGIVLLVIGCLSPAAYLNNKIISIFPVWNNLIIEDGLWSWRDISFFSVTLMLVIFVSLYFIYKKNYYGLIFSAVLFFTTILIMFAAVLYTQYKYSSYPDIIMKLGWAWIILLIGSVMFSLIRKTPYKQHS